VLKPWKTVMRYKNCTGDFEMRIGGPLFWATGSRSKVTVSVLSQTPST